VGMLSRLKDIMASNVNALLDKAADPEKAMDEYMRSLNRDLGQVKAEAASAEAEERRAKRAWDECRAEVRKLQGYAEKAAADGSDENALKFLERKAAVAGKEPPLQAAHELAAANAADLLRMQDKLAADVNELEARRSRLKGRMAAAKAQQRVNESSSPLDGSSSIFDEAEKKADSAYHEAMAVAKLRADDRKDDLEEELARLDKDTAAKPEDELAALKEKMEKKE
jgi:phage shock protein A